MPVLKKEALEKYLASLFGTKVEVIALREFKGNETGRELKGFGYGSPVLIEYKCDGKKDSAVLNTVKPSAFGYEYPSDRASSLLLDHANFNKLPFHVRSLDIGAFTEEGELISLGKAGEFFLLTEYAQGRLYFHDLQQIAAVGELTAGDKERALALARYLANIHSQKKVAPELYRRRLRDLVGHGEGIMGLTDSYPSDFKLASPEFLEKVERKCVTWRWKIKDKTYRLSQVHGDFHPFNVLFRTGVEFTLLDRSRGEWGEPADDVSCMTINYIFFSLQRYGMLAGPFEQLFHLFWDQYLELTGDEEMLCVVQPFYAWRALVVASPIWYPNLVPEVRRKLFNFLDSVLDLDVFDVQRVNNYMNA